MILSNLGMNMKFLFAKTETNMIVYWELNDVATNYTMKSSELNSNVKVGSNPLFSYHLEVFSNVMEK